MCLWELCLGRLERRKEENDEVGREVLIEMGGPFLIKNDQECLLREPLFSGNAIVVGNKQPATDNTNASTITTSHSASVMGVTKACGISFVWSVEWDFSFFIQYVS